MQRTVYTVSLAAAVSAMLFVSASSSFGAAPGAGSGSGGTSKDGTGDVFADLIVTLRDVNGVPLLTPFTVAGDAGPTTEYCLQPVSYSALPGLTDADRVTNPVDGRLVYRIPLVGSTPVPTTDAETVTACDPQPAYAMYVAEAELERLNMARQPADVQAMKLSEVSLRLASATDITLDGAGRITTDGTPIDAAPDHAAIFASLMATGTIPGLAATPAQVKGFDAWKLAAASVGTASGKDVPLTIDSVEYYNRIVGVPAGYVPSPAWKVNFLQTVPSNGEQFVDFSHFSYTRSNVFRGCVTWLDVPKLTWMVSPVSKVVTFADLPPIARDTDGNGAPDTVDNIAGFAQLADDVRSAISYLHANDVIAGFFMDPVGTDTCAAQRASLTDPAVKWGGVPAEIIQTDVVPVTASLYMPWAGSTVSAAQVRLTIKPDDPAQAFTDAAQVTAVAKDGEAAGQSVAFTAVNGTLVGRWGPESGFVVNPGYSQTTTFDVSVAAGAPTGATTLTLELVDLANGEAVLASDNASTNVSAAAATVVWTSVADYATQGTFTPMTARLFNPDLGGPDAGQGEVMGAQFRVTLHAPEPFAMATQVSAWSDAVAMPLALDASGNLTGLWALPSPIPIPYDQLTTWYFNVAEGAPIGLYTVTLDLLGAGGAPLSTDVADITLAPASTHEGGGTGGGGGGGDGDGDGDATLPPVAAITDGTAVITSDTSATFTLAADQDSVSFACALDGAALTACSSPVTYTGLADGAHTFAARAASSAGKVGPTAVWTWTVDTVAPSVNIVSAPAPGSTAADATFAFSAVGQVAVLCAVDGAALDRCSSPVTYRTLSLGSHTFVVAAVDAAGNYASMSHQWTVLTSNGAFFRALYSDTLGRSASDAEISWWLGRLADGTSRTDLAAGVVRSDEGTSFAITRLYRDTLKREPDAAGLAWWIGVAKRGTPLSTIASAFYGSSEYFTGAGNGENEAWVRQLYRTLLSREPDASGLAHWVGAVVTGTSREDVASGIYQSTESAGRRVDALYRNLLHRSADPGGVVTWTPYLITRGDLALTVALTSSEEYVRNASL